MRQFVFVSRWVIAWTIALIVCHDFFVDSAWWVYVVVGMIFGLLVEVSHIDSDFI